MTSTRRFAARRAIWLPMADASIVARNRKAAASRVRVARVRRETAQARLETRMAGAWDEAGTVTVPTLAEIRARVDAAVARIKGAA